MCIITVLNACICMHNLLKDFWEETPLLLYSPGRIWCSLLHECVDMYTRDSHVIRSWPFTINLRTLDILASLEVMTSQTFDYKIENINRFVYNLAVNWFYIKSLTQLHVFVLFLTEVCHFHPFQLALDQLQEQEGTCKIT